MKLIHLNFSSIDLRALLDRRAEVLAFTTDEHGEPIRIELRVAEHHQPKDRAAALGRPPRTA